MTMKACLVLWAAAFALGLGAGCELVVDLDSLNDQQCAPDEKQCPEQNRCVKLDQADTRCGAKICSPCVFENAQATCRLDDLSGKLECARGACNAGYLDCNHDDTDGCETDALHDPQNCTDCEIVCSTPANGFPGCSSGCTIGGCKPGFDDCDNLDANGCEENLMTSAQHCGRCNNPCPGGCQLGVCPP